MGYYHLQVRVGSPKTAAGHCAYIQRKGRFLTKQGDLHHTESGNLPVWAAGDPKIFWSTADRFEILRQYPYREIEVAVAVEANDSQRTALIREFVDSVLADRHAYTWALHGPKSTGGGPRPHAHIMFSERIRDGIDRDPAGYFGKPTAKDPALRGAGKELLFNRRPSIDIIRSTWSAIANDFYERHGIDVTIDERSLRAQGRLLEAKVFDHRRNSASRTATHQARVAFSRALVARNVERMLVRPEIALESITQDRMDFSRQDLELQLRRMTDTDVQFQSVLLKVLTCDQLVFSEPARRDAEVRYTTHALRGLGTELDAQSMRIAQSRRGLSAPLERARRPALVLTAEEERATDLFSGPNGMATLSGSLGSGRSTVLKVMNARLSCAGVTVLGVAPGWRAAERLQRDTGIESVSLSTFRRHLDRDQLCFDPPPMLVVEDADQFQLRSLKAILDAVESSPVRIRLVGNLTALNPVYPEPAFRRLERGAIAAEASAILPLSLRQAHGWQRDATAAVTRAALPEALDAYAMQGRITGNASERAARLDLIGRWLEDRRAYPSETQVLIAETEEQRRRLNADARLALVQHGLLDPGQSLRGRSWSLEVATGERVRFTRPRHKLGIETGMLATVQEVRPEGWLVRSDTGEEHLVTPDLQPFVAHGYALSIETVAGLTVDRSYFQASPTIHRRAAQIALTRHRHDLQVTYSRSAFPDAPALIALLGREPERKPSPSVPIRAIAITSRAIPPLPALDRVQTHAAVPRTPERTETYPLSLSPLQREEWLRAPPEPARRPPERFHHPDLPEPEPGRGPARTRTRERSRARFREHEQDQER